MIARLKKAYSLDVFNNEEERQVARILLAIMLGGLVICLTTLFSGLYWEIPSITWIGISGMLSLGIALIFFTFRHLSASGFVFALSSLILVTLVAMRGHGVHDIIVVAYPVVTFFSVLILKRFWSVTVSLIALLAVSWLVLGEIFGLYIPTLHHETGIMDLFGIITILAGSYLLTNVQAGNIRRTLVKAQEEIVQRKSMEEKLRFLGTHDMLTGSYNRMFLDEETTRLEHSRDYPISVILSDMDDLKETNDSLGHEAGDELIRRAHQVLRSSIREGDILARIGGDEFAILLPGTNEDTVAEIVTRIRDRKRVLNAAQPDMTVRLSIGAATAQRGSLQNTFREADKRMYENKAARKLNPDTTPRPVK